jgi:tetratricopeptide (TPR) repeat protein
MIAPRLLSLALCFALASPAQRPPAPTSTAGQGSQVSNGNNSPNISDVNGNVILQYGVPPKQLYELLQAAGKSQLQKIDVLSKQLQTTSEAVRGFLTILNASDVPVERWPQTLNEIAKRYRDMLQRLAVLDPENPKSKSILEQARTILNQAHSVAEYDRADALLAQVEAADTQGVQESEALEHEAREAVRGKRRGAAAARAERGELSMMRLDYLQAAQHFKVAAETIDVGEDMLRVNYLNRYAGALYRYGDEKGDNAVLAQAIGVYSKTLGTLKREELPLVWAMTQNNLGSALRILGEREGGTGRLEEAVTAYRQALLERTRERVPLDWAATQNNLGNALNTLGERESGTGRLEEAITAYRQALLEYTRERVPLDWATAQNNLGNALSILGERASGTGRLEEAVAAYRQALLECTRERAPLDWAMTQTNLGTALAVLGNRENGTGRLEEAVAAYRQALLERTRERVPLDWAGTQGDLGNALKALGERESGTGRLEEAVTAYRQALLEYTRERVPLDWAATQSNLGNALKALGERESGTGRLEEAVTDYRQALLECTRERVPLNWAAIQNNLGTALAALGEREDGTGRLEEAVSAIQSARTVYSAAGMHQYESDFEKRLESIRSLIAQRYSK